MLDRAEALETPEIEVTTRQWDKGNSVGVGADGTTPAGNNLHGVVLRSDDNLSPPLGPGQANRPAVSGNVIGLNPNTNFSGHGEADQVGDQADALADAVPEAALQPRGGRDQDRLSAEAAPAALLDGGLPGPAGAGQHPAGAAAAAPGGEAQLPLVPDRHQPLGVPVQEPDLALAVPVVDAGFQAVSLDQVRQQFAQGQRNSHAHRRLTPFAPKPGSRPP
jgi:hypothetical protein